MNEGTSAIGGGNRQAQIDEQKAKAEQDFQQQLQMMDLQRQVNSNNTFITALSTLEKGKDDVCRAIANNCK